MTLNLEFSERLDLGFEHHGIQHFQHVPLFHTGSKFQRTQELDVIKRQRCSDAGVRLIEVRWDYVDVEAFLREVL